MDKQKEIELEKLNERSKLIYYGLVELLGFHSLDEIECAIQIIKDSRVVQV